MLAAAIDSTTHASQRAAHIAHQLILPALLMQLVLLVRQVLAVLLFCLVVAWLVPLDSLLALDFLPRFVCAVLLAFAPILIANLIFAQRFKDVVESVTAFGANLLGAMLGGILEYTSLVTGYRALLILVAALYGLSLVASPGLLRRPA